MEVIWTMKRLCGHILQRFRTHIGRYRFARAAKSCRSSPVLKFPGKWFPCCVDFHAARRLVNWSEVTAIQIWNTGTRAQDNTSVANWSPIRKTCIFKCWTIEYSKRKNRTPQLQNGLRSRGVLQMERKVGAGMQEWDEKPVGTWACQKFGFEQRCCQIQSSKGCSWKTKTTKQSKS